MIVAFLDEQTVPIEVTVRKGSIVLVEQSTNWLQPAILGHGRLRTRNGDSGRTGCYFRHSGLSAVYKINNLNGMYWDAFIKSLSNGCNCDIGTIFSHHQRGTESDSSHLRNIRFSLFSGPERLRDDEVCAVSTSL